MPAWEVMSRKWICWGWADTATSGIRKSFVIFVPNPTRRRLGFVSGHGFSRAAKATVLTTTLAAVDAAANADFLFLMAPARLKPCPDTRLKFGLRETKASLPITWRPRRKCEPSFARPDGRERPSPHDSRPAPAAAPKRARESPAARCCPRD